MNDTAIGGLIGAAVSSLGATGADTDTEKLRDDAEKMLSKYDGVTSVESIDMSTLFDEVTALADSNHIEVPGRFTMLLRSIITIEGVIEEFCPELNLFELLSNKLMERAKKSFNLKSTVTNIGRELLEVGEKTVKLPVLIADALNNLNKGRAKVNVEVKGIDEPLHRIGEFLRYTLLIVVACVLFTGSCILCMTKLEPKVAGNVPLVAVVGILFSIALAIFAIKKLWKLK